MTGFNLSALNILGIIYFFLLPPPVHNVPVEAAVPVQVVPLRDETVEVVPLRVVPLTSNVNLDDLVLKLNTEVCHIDIFF